MPDIKTTIVGIITGIIGALGYFHVLISPELSALLVALGSAIVGYLAKDKPSIANTRE